MTTTREALPEQVRIQVLKMRDLVRTIENAPLNEVVAAIENLKAEIDTPLWHMPWKLPERRHKNLPLPSKNSANRSKPERSSA